MHQQNLRTVIVASALQAMGLACSRGVLHTGAAGTAVAPPIPAPVHPASGTTCDSGLDACSGQGTGPEGTCDPGLAACPGSGAGYCFDLQAAPDHCGTCDNACALGSPCDNGQCRVVHCTSQTSVRTLRVEDGLGYFYQAALTDCDRDGVLDMIAPSPPRLRASENPPTAGWESVSVYRGSGDGTFVLGDRYPAEVSTTGMYTSFPVVVADLNRDQIPDIVMRALPSSDSSTPADEQITIVTRLGNGDCTFGPEIGLAAGARPSSIAIADLDGDGILDLTNAADDGKRLSTYHGNGNGSFSNRQDLGVGGIPRTVTVTDWNSDGIPDLVAADIYVHVLLGTGNGHFAPVIDCALSLQAPTGGPATPPVIADFDRDGIVDLVSNNTVLFGMHECNFTRQATFRAAYDSAYPLAAGDFNGDGALDLAFASWEGVGFLPGDGQGNFGNVVILGDLDAPNLQPEYTVVFAGDVNGDGRLDLMVANQISVRTFLNTCQ